MPRTVLLAMLPVVLLSCCLPAAAVGSTQSQNSVRCRMYPVTRSGHDALGELVVTIELDASVCFNGKKIIYASETCKVPYQDANTVTTDPCTTSHYYYGWAASGPQRPKGGYYSQATFVMHSCLFKVGCWSSYNVTLGVYVNARGQSTSDDGR